MTQADLDIIDDIESINTYAEFCQTMSRITPHSRQNVINLGRKDTNGTYKPYECAVFQVL